MNKRSSRQRCNGPTGRQQSGLALIEVLVSMLVIAFWLLASAGMQAGMFKLQKSAEFRLRALALAAELGERMEANPVAGKAGSYAMAEDATPSAASDCAKEFCNSDALAQYDLNQWRARVMGSMDIDKVSVVRDTTATLPTYTISISWKEPRGSQTYGTTGTTETASFITTKVLG